MSEKGKPIGNMYRWVHVIKFNHLGGPCGHKCPWCYVPKLRFVKKKYSGKIRLIDKVFKQKPPHTDLPIFLCDCNDLFENAVPAQYILKILQWCNQFPYATFLIQTQNPGRMKMFIDNLPKNAILGITLQTNRPLPMTNAPSPYYRYLSFANPIFDNFTKMVNVGPIMKFDLDILVSWLKAIKPAFVSFEADSKNNNLVEPTADEIRKLINEASQFTEVRPKENLNRILVGQD